ncbi:hypothetical protein B0T16DRAFT_497469 [Cercophora newfieldiana]|uniref:Uncharacterized protein n=1 Tax=Cercophora newfieldiana TaxID=92897 RepID=A0AA39XSD8_9PEZI|nr:hypothetical protein B0T16DRAFT_497469 [Cercophora newfieldiana]
MSDTNKDEWPFLFPEVPLAASPGAPALIEGCSLAEPERDFSDGTYRLTATMMIAYSAMRGGQRGVILWDEKEMQSPLVSLLHRQDREREAWQPKIIVDIAESVRDRPTNLDDDNREEVFLYKRDENDDHLVVPQAPPTTPGHSRNMMGGPPNSPTLPSSSGESSPGYASEQEGDINPRGQCIENKKRLQEFGGKLSFMKNSTSLLHGSVPEASSPDNLASTQEQLETCSISGQNGDSSPSEDSQQGSWYESQAPHAYTQAQNIPSMRSTIPNRPLTAAETAGVSSRNDPQFNNETGSLFSAHYSVPETPALMLDAPGINPGGLLFHNSESQYAYDRMAPLAGRQLRSIQQTHSMQPPSENNAHFTQASANNTHEHFMPQSSVNNAYFAQASTDNPQGHFMPQSSVNIAFFAQTSTGNAQGHFMPQTSVNNGHFAQTSTYNTHFAQSEVDAAVRFYPGRIYGNITGIEAPDFIEATTREIQLLKAQDDDIRKQLFALTSKQKVLSQQHKMAEVTASSISTTQTNRGEANSTHTTRALQRQDVIRNYVAKSIHELKCERDLRKQAVSEGEEQCQNLKESVEYLEGEIKTICESVGCSNIEELLAHRPARSISRSI